MAESNTVLVLDDSEFILTKTADALEAAGHRVKTANTVFAARKLAESGCDLILMDVEFAMNQQEGASATRALKAAAATRDIPIILHSGLPEDVLAGLTLETGADGYIEKTDDTDKLIQHISWYLAAGTGNTGDSARS